MTFRSQILLTFAPIFLLLGASGETVLTLLERREALWGLKEEGSSLAVATAEFLRDQPFKSPAAGKSPTRSWEDSLALIMRRGQARSIFILGPDGRTLRWRAGPPAGSLVPVIPALAMKRLESELWVCGEPSGDGATSVMETYTALKSAGGRIVGYLAVEINASDFTMLADEYLHSIAVGAGLSLLVGLFVMGIVAEPVVRGTQELQDSARQALEGKTLVPPGAHFIQEIGDLGQTFGTVGTLLNEAVDKTKRVLVENEQLRTTADLANMFNLRFSPPSEAALGGISLAARLIGPAHGAFFGWVRGKAAVHVFVGTVGAQDDLRKVIAASAARTFIADALGRMGVPEAFEEASRIFALTSWECALLPDVGDLALWTAPAGESAPRRSEPPVGQPFCLHTPSTAPDSLIESCLESYRGLAAAELVAAIANLAGSDANGALLVVRP